MMRMERDHAGELCVCGCVDGLSLQKILFLGDDANV